MSLTRSFLAKSLAHKYKDRKKNAKGEWVYTYETVHDFAANHLNKPGWKVTPKGDTWHVQYPNGSDKTYTHSSMRAIAAKHGHTIGADTAPPAAPVSKKAAAAPVSKKAAPPKPATPVPTPVKTKPAPQPALVVQSPPPAPDMTPMLPPSDVALLRIGAKRWMGKRAEPPVEWRGARPSNVPDGVWHGIAAWGNEVQSVIADIHGLHPEQATAAAGTAQGMLAAVRDAVQHAAPVDQLLGMMIEGYNQIATMQRTVAKNRNTEQRGILIAYAQKKWGASDRPMSEIAQAFADKMPATLDPTLRIAVGRWAADMLRRTQSFGSAFPPSDRAKVTRFMESNVFPTMAAIATNKKVSTNEAWNRMATDTAALEGLAKKHGLYHNGPPILNQQLNGRETHPPLAFPVTLTAGSGTTAQSLRTRANTLDAQIYEKENPATAQQNVTYRRSTIITSMRDDANVLKRVQRAMRGLSHHHDQGSIPAVLDGIDSVAAVRRILHHGKYGKVPVAHPYMPDPDAAYFKKHGATDAWLQSAYEALDTMAGSDTTVDVKKQAVDAAERAIIGVPIPGFFATAPTVVADMLRVADIQPGMRVLEPSAGKGNIADAIKRDHPDSSLDVIEMNGSLRGILELKDHNVVGHDIFDHADTYDRIVMNPPFEKGADMEHVQHAYGLLKPGGKLVAIMSEGPFFRNDNKATSFRRWLHTQGGESATVERGNYGNDHGRATNVATRMVVLEKP